MVELEVGAGSVTLLASPAWVLSPSFCWSQFHAAQLDQGGMLRSLVLWLHPHLNVCPHSTVACRVWQHLHMPTGPEAKGHRWSSSTCACNDTRHHQPCHQLINKCGLGARVLLPTFCCSVFWAVVVSRNAAPPQRIIHTLSPFALQW